MAVSYRAFLAELYEEYLADAAFLYAQRLALMADPAMAWTKVGAFEDRLEAHLDGLVVGGEPALEVCVRHAEGDDAGELFAAVSVFCRQQRQDLVMAALDRLDPGAEQAAGAAADALKYELPAAWLPDWIGLLQNGDPKLAPILARAFGYRRVGCGPQLAAAMERCAPSALPAVIWALGRIAYQPAAERLIDYLRSGDKATRSAAALAVARMGEWGRSSACEEGQVADLPRILAVAGGPEAVRLLGSDGTSDATTALGLLGAPECVPALISRLERPDVAPCAAAALECITGAGFYETVFVPEEVDEDELSEFERQAAEEGKPPDRGDGRPYGSNVTRVSRDAVQWHDWWQAHSDRFAPGLRYRSGALLTPARLVDLLAAPQTPHEVRRFSGEELAARYGEDFGFEPDMPAARQAALLADAWISVRRSADRFLEGGWYRGGRPIA